jgi:hypothetical protein
MKTLFTLTTLLIFATAHAQSHSLPKPFDSLFKSKGLNQDFSLNYSLKPAWLKADFNGDGVADLAVMVNGKTSTKKGLLVIHGKTGKYFIFGAGTPIAKMDDLSWVDNWGLYKERTAYETKVDDNTGDIKSGKIVRLHHPGVLIQYMEGGRPTSGGILYFTGKTYRLIHQGE